jgi:hypothetical protein
MFRFAFAAGALALGLGSPAFAMGWGGAGDPAANLAFGLSGLGVIALLLLLIVVIVMALRKPLARAVVWLSARRRLVIGAFVLAPVFLSGCSAVTTLTSPALTPTQVIVAANAFDAIEATATNYLSLPTCPTATPVCKTAAGVNAIVPAIRTGRAARNTLEAAVNSGGATPLSVSTYTTLTTAITTLQAVMAQYAVKS